MKLVIENGYIVCAYKESENDKDYANLKQIMKVKPTNAPEGYRYRLSQNLEWVLCENPIEEELGNNDDMGIDEQS